MRMHCLYCKKFIFIATEEWKRNNIRGNKLKVAPMCAACMQAEIDGKTLIRGVGPVDTPNEVTTRNRRMGIEALRQAVNFEEIDRTLDNGGFKLKQLADQLNANATDLRTLIIEHYGERIVFVRGRNGGVKWR